VAVRGYLRDSGDGLFHVEPCPLDCGSWLSYSGIDLAGVDAGEYGAYLGTALAVDVYGDLAGAPMPGGPYLIGTAVQATPGNDCSPVADEPTSWSSLKAAYR
jgi:hypothetical protein